MPSLIRFLVFLLVLGGLGYGGIFALATMVEPRPRIMTETISADLLPG
ncbi:MAG: histidine kinase [Cohaesibacteraceae bacterium]|nr:histidine kinase [Cohaesibacteraceae bacterium]MBL4875052.1 histidine kinase [Cohaesibacteraceae bacterium]